VPIAKGLRIESVKQRNSQAVTTANNQVNENADYKI